MSLPPLIKWYRYCEAKRFALIYHGFTLGAVAVLSAVFVNYTHLLPLYGGGKHLLGGTYFFVYYLGIVLSGFHRYASLLSKKQLSLLACGSFFMFFVWSVAIYINVLPFDRILQPFWGNGDNPPSVNYIAYAVFVFLFGFSFFSLAAASENKYLQALSRSAVFLGENSLYIFLYHFLIRTVLFKLFPGIIDSAFLVAIIVFPIMMALPAIAKDFFFRFVAQQKKRFSG